MENQQVDILELFKTNPAEAWRIIHSLPRTPINKEEFFKDLMRKKEQREQQKRNEATKSKQT